MIMVKRAGSPLVPLLDGYMSWCIANAQGLYALLAYAKPTSGSLTIQFRKLIRPSNSEDAAITAAAPQDAKTRLLAMPSWPPCGHAVDAHRRHDHRFTYPYAIRPQ